MAAERKQNNLSRALADIDDAEIAAPLVANLKQLGERKRALEAERDAIAGRWLSAQVTRHSLDSIRARIIPATAIVGWSEPLTNRPQPGAESDPLNSLTYQQRRDVLTALGIKVMLYRADHAPRYVIEANITLEGKGNIVTGSGTSSCLLHSSMASGRRTNRSSRRRNARGTPIPPRAAIASPAR